MAKFSDMSQQGRLAVIAGVVLLLTGVMYFTMFKSIADANHEKKLKLEAKQAENDKLRPYERNLPELNRTTEALRMQLETLQRIVPDEKDADQFMHAMQNEAKEAEVVVRRYTAKSAVSQEFYTELPFDIQVDGPYYSILKFFDRVGKLERIINISGLKLWAIKGRDKPSGQGIKEYAYAPHETVIATCQASTFFSHDSQHPADNLKNGNGSNKTKK